MTDIVPAAATEAAIRDKVAIALHDLECGDRTCEPQTLGVFYRRADFVLAAIDLDAIAADAYQRGKADERETVLAWLRRDPTVPDLTWEIEHGQHETPDANQNPPQ